ncbi:hypothetical protein ACFLTA_05985 [Bacteroidota bacterium]
MVIFNLHKEKEMIGAVKNPVSKTITAILIFLVVLLNFLFPGVKVLTWDFFGYYLYLPLTFIYHDLSLENIGLLRELFEQYEPATSLYHVFNSPEGGWVIKYSMGIALLNAPFFFIGHLFALVSDFPADGFSMPYQKALWFGAMAYTIIGLLYLRKILVNFLSDQVSALVMLIIILGTNYLNYTALFAQNTISQNYIFTLYVFIVWFSIRWHRKQKLFDLLLLSFVCGLNILSRPTEVVCLLIPMFWGIHDRESVVAKLRLLSTQWKQLMGFAFILIVFGSLQLIYWKLTTGNFLFNSYSNNPGEGLDLHNPHFLNVLFSFRKGWLVYTPVMGISLLGFIYMYRAKREIFYPVLLYFLFNLYLVSCWSTWWYAFSFGLRPLIPSYAVLALPMGFLLTELIRRKWMAKTPVFILLGFLIGLNLFQTWQYSKDIIHGSRMTRSYYFRVFCKTEINDEDRKLLLVSRSEWPVEKVPDEMDYSKRRLYYNSYENKNALPGDSLPYHRMDPDSRFTPAFKAAFEDLTKKDHFYVRASAEIYLPEGHPSEAPLIVMSFEHKGKLYKYNTMALDTAKIKFNAWNTLEMDYLSPHPRSKRDELGVYLWYRGEEYVFIRNMEIVLFEPENNDLP